MRKSSDINELVDLAHAVIVGKFLPNDDCYSAVTEFFSALHNAERYLPQQSYYKIVSITFSAVDGPLPIGPRGELRSVEQVTHFAMWSAAASGAAYHLAVQEANGYVDEDLVIYRDDLIDSSHELIAQQRKHPEQMRFYLLPTDVADEWQITVQFRNQEQS